MGKITHFIVFDSSKLAQPSRAALKSPAGIQHVSCRNLGERWANKIEAFDRYLRCSRKAPSSRISLTPHLSTHRMDWHTDCATGAFAAGSGERRGAHKHLPLLHRRSLSQYPQDPGCHKELLPGITFKSRSLLEAIMPATGRCRLPSGSARHTTQRAAC